MRPQQWVVGGGDGGGGCDSGGSGGGCDSGGSGGGCDSGGGGDVAMVVGSPRMILCLKKVRYSLLLKRRDLRTYGRTDGRTDPLIEMRGRTSKQVW